MTKISVVLPTYNRSDKIKDTLDCLLDQETAGEIEVEILVVDNNSTDNTRQTIESYAPRFRGTLRYLFEPSQGRTFALNTGIKASSGEIITCVDDDCLLEKDHLLKINRIFATHPNVGFIGGKIYPHWTDGKYPAWLEEFLPNQPLRSNNPDWFNEFFCGPLGILDYGAAPFIIDYSAPNPDQRHFYGANISFRRDLFDRFGYFDEASILVEDTEMCIRLLKGGIKGRYSPELTVFHKINAANVSTDYYQRWYAAKGLRREIVEKYKLKFYHPFGLQIAFLKKTLAMHLQSFTAKTFKQRLYLRCQVLFNVGQIKKIIRQSEGRVFGVNYLESDVMEHAPKAAPRNGRPVDTPQPQPVKNLISVIICTRNRAGSLKDVLSGLLEQKPIDNVDFEVLIVDNNSIDNTKEMVMSFAPQFNGRLRYLFEPTPGKPYALNLGIREAKGSLVVSTDDDCILENDYLENNYRTFDKAGNAVGFIGGKILPYWIGDDRPSWLNDILALPSRTEDGKPNWFKMFFEGPLGILDYGNEPFEIDNDEKHGRRLFYGANMAFQRGLFDRFGDFRLDKTITQDTEICLRLLEGGIKGLYAPTVRVFHKINTSKINPRYYYRWYFLRGQYLEEKERYLRKFYHPLGVQYSLIWQTLALLNRSLLEKSYSRRLHYRCQAAYNMGFMKKIAKKNLI